MDEPSQGQAAASPSSPGSSPASPPGPALEAGRGPEGKECPLCREVISAYADRCAHCGGFLPILEGRAFGQHFYLLLTCMALFIGTLLPWEGMWWDSYGWRGLGGGFLLLLSGYGMVASYFNIFHRQMIVWPVILCAFEGTWFGWQRALQLASSSFAQKIDWNGDLGQKKVALIQFLRLFGPGLWLVVIFSTLFWLVFVVSVIQGGRSAGARKEAEKAARAARRTA